MRGLTHNVTGLGWQVACHAPQQTRLARAFITGDGNQAGLRRAGH
jgi:hypothetical protein